MRVIVCAYDEAERLPATLAALAGAQVVVADDGEYPIPLAHRATGRSWSGFLHRGRQLVDLIAAAGTRRCRVTPRDRG